MWLIRTMERAEATSSNSSSHHFSINLYTGPSTLEMETYYIKTSVSPILLHVKSMKITFEFETFGSHDSVYDHNHHLGCDTV